MENHWYIACRSGQLKKRPLARTILDSPLVIFRENRLAAALVDRCAHRNMALSRGKAEKGGIRCSYHGWQWDSAGRCVDIPASCQDCGTYRKIKIRAYPVVEKQGFVWVWRGAGKPVNEPLDFPEFDAPGWHHWVMERKFAGAAFHCVENFLDVPHTAHVHRGLFRGAESKEIEIEVTYGADSVEAAFLNEERMESLIGRLLVPEGEKIEHRDRFQVPFVTRVDYRMTEKRQYIVMSQCTPVSENETRVYTYMAYRFAPFGLAVRAVFEPLAHLILNQDVKVIREQTEDLARTGAPRFLYGETDVIARGIRDLLDGKSLAGKKPERRKIRA